jgi:hypothetical protein
LQLLAVSAARVWGIREQRCGGREGDSLYPAMSKGKKKRKEKKRKRKGALGRQRGGLFAHSWCILGLAWQVDAKGGEKVEDEEVKEGIQTSRGFIWL